MTIEEANIREEVLLICGCDVTRCMKCGKCSASCPAYDEFDIKPHQFASYIARGDMYEGYPVQDRSGYTAAAADERTAP